VKWVAAAWALVRDVALTGLGIFLILQQALWVHHQSGTLLVVGVTLTSPALYEHGKRVLSGPGDMPSSPASQPHGSPPGSPPPEGE
jgi:hypothetical protein